MYGSESHVVFVSRKKNDQSGVVKSLLHEQWWTEQPLQILPKGQDQFQPKQVYQRIVSSTTFRCNKWYDREKQHNKKLEKLEKAQTRPKKFRKQVGYMGTCCSGRLHITVYEFYSDKKVKNVIGKRIAVIDDHLPHMHNHELKWENRFTAALPKWIRNKGSEYFNKLNMIKKDWMRYMRDYCDEHLIDDINREMGWIPNTKVSYL